MTEDEIAKELIAQYTTLCHSIQCAVGYDKLQRGQEGEKHLRTGINLAMVDSGALAAILIDKGIITQLEYYRSLVEGCKKELARYEAMYPGITFI